MGEIAVQNALKIPFLEYTAGYSNNYNHPDLEAAGFAVGVKTSQYPNFPAVPRFAVEPQIIVILDKYRRGALIAGLASRELLQENNRDKRNDYYIKSNTMLDRKTAFTRLTELEHLSAINKYRIERR